MTIGAIGAASTVSVALLLDEQTAAFVTTSDSTVGVPAVPAVKLTALVFVEPLKVPLATDHA